MACGDVEDHFRNEKRTEPWGAVAFCESDNFFLEGDQSANAAGENYAYTIYIQICLRDTGIFNRLIACCQCCLGKPASYL